MQRAWTVAATHDLRRLPHFEFRAEMLVGVTVQPSSGHQGQKTALYVDEPPPIHDGGGMSLDPPALGLGGRRKGSWVIVALGHAAYDRH